MNKNRGFLLIEILITISIFSLIIFSLNKFIINIYENRKYIDNDVNKLENEIFFLDSLILDISLRDIGFDILNKDIYVDSACIVFMKDNEIIKYEYKDKNIYVSSRLINEKYFKMKVRVISCDNFLFFKEDNKLILIIKNKGKSIKRVLNLWKIRGIY